MNKLFSIKFLPLLALMISASILFTSCGDDPEEMMEITGCMDPAADNYNPNATVSGDCDFTGCTDPLAQNYDANANVSGDCVYFRDKFLGSFTGSIDCPGQLSILSSDSLEFSIAEGLEVDMPQDVILSITLNNFPLALAATVESNDTLFIMHTIPGVTIPDIPFIGDIEGDVTADGRGTMSTDETTLMATLEVSVDSDQLPLTLTDNCTLIGIKQ